MKFLSAIALIDIALTSSVSATLSAIKTHETELAPARADLINFADELASIKSELLAAMESNNEEQGIELAALKANNEEQGIELAAVKADNEEQGIELDAVKAELAAVKSDLSAALKSKSELNESAENGPFSNPEKNHLRQLRKTSKEGERDNDLVNSAYAGGAHKDKRALLGFPVDPFKKLSSDLKLKSLYVYEKLDAGETRTIFQSGPIKVDAGCGGGTPATQTDICDDESEVCLGVTLEYDEDILVFGDMEMDGVMSKPPINSDTQVLLAGDVYTGELWDVSRSGNDIDDGAIWTSTGHYFGWNGDSLIGVQRDGGLSIVGGNCIIAGVINYVIPAFGESV